MTTTPTNNNGLDMCPKKYAILLRERRKGKKEVELELAKAAAIEVVLKMRRNIEGKEGRKEGRRRKDKVL